MIAAQKTSFLVEEEKYFLRALLYFDLFNYPLTSDEVAKFSPQAINFFSEQSLENLVQRKIIYRFQNYYSIQNDKELIARRIKGNALAERKVKIALRISRVLASLPFVRAVLLSGSISKGFMDEKSDIDYFIVTETNRLWIVRTAIAIFRRVFLLNSHKNLCTNYFIDTTNLEITEKNIFTAIELCTLKPMYGEAVIEDFKEANKWIYSFLPNQQFEKEKIGEGNSFFKKIVERIFSFQFFDYFNEWLLKKTMVYWRRKYGKEMDANDFELAFRSTTGISKSHPQFFQKKVLTRYGQKIKEFETNTGMDLAL